MKRILYLQYTNPGGYPPLEHSSRILAGEGWKVLFIGTGAQGANALEFPPHPNIEVRKLKFCPAGWRQKLHYFWFSLWSLAWILRWRPKWVYASDPASSPVALVATLLPGLQIVYHEHDSPTPTARPQETSDKKPPSRFQRLVRWARKKLARRAALCILPNETRAAQFKDETGTRRPVICVWNCPRREEVSTKLAAEAGDFVLFYHGSIVPGRLPLTVIDALSTLPGNIVLCVAGYETIGHKGYLQDLKERACRHGIGSRLKLHGTIPQRHQLLEYCRKGHVGIAFMPKDSIDVNEQAMTGASNKPFDYLASGLALLVSDLPDWKRLFVESGYGLACDPEDSRSIAKALSWFIEHPEETQKMGQRGQEQILQKWNYDVLFATVLKKLEASDKDILFPA
jgi:glycosyltransferase involved in cell wall biosynthesis